MPDNTYLDALLVAEVLVIVHLACNEGISALMQSIIEQEVASTTTERYLLDGTTQQLVTQRTLHTELAFYHENEVIGSHGLWQFAYYTTTCLHVTYLLLCKELTFLQSQSLSNLPVNTILGIIHIGVHGDDDDVVLQRLDNATLHIVSTTNLLQATEQQRMMADDEVTPLADSLIDNLFVDVQTQ